MFKNYLIVALRRFRRGRTHAVVNVLGLALGMATCSLIFLLVFHEWSYDRFHENADDIFRSYLRDESPEGEEAVQAMMPPDFTPAFKAEYPAVTEASRLVRSSFDFRRGESISRLQMAEIDADFFRMFSFEVLAGDAVGAIADPTSVVLTAESAGTAFGIRDGAWSNALGESVTVLAGDSEYEFAVGAVIADFPDNSSISFDAAISFENYDEIYAGGNNWGGRTTTYVRLAEGADADMLEASFGPFTDAQFGGYVQGMRRAEQISEADGSYALRLQPLTDIHRNMFVWLPYEANAHNPMYSYILLGIGFMILLIACINFMTISLGQSTVRALEVGVRKVLGADRTAIMRQHWGESLVMASMALVIGIILALLALPAFSNLAGTRLSFGIIPAWMLILALVSLVGIVGLLAGSYPAIVLSRFVPVRVLKGSGSAPRNGLLTRGLVVVQFTISIGLIVSTGIMSNQLSYLLEKDLGFDDFVLAVQAQQVGRSEADGVLSYMREELTAYDGITGLARAGYTFTRGSDRNGWGDASGTNRSAYNFGVDEYWVDVMGVDVIEGRNFSPDRPADATNSILVNEALVREFGIEEPVGYVMTNWLSGIYEESPTVIGVVADYHFQSLHNDVQPAIMNMHPNYYNYLGAIMIKVRPDRIDESLERIEAAWNEVLPGKPFSYSFVDQDLDAQYANEKRWQTLVTVSSLLAILIACLGLFGLALLSVGRRTKEIGVRKVLGASVGSLTALLSREFALLVIIASLLASPIAFLAMRSWLSGFAYQISIGPWTFVWATLGALVIALGTVAVHTVRAAQRIPTRALRYE